MKRTSVAAVLLVAGVLMSAGSVWMMLPWLAVRVNYPPSQMGETDQLLRCLSAFLRDHRNERGAYPSADEVWRAAAADEMLSAWCAAFFHGVTLNEERCTDAWGFTLVYEPPADLAANLEDEELRLMARSVGENGIDDGGLRDDVVAGGGVRDGFYYKARWPRWRLLTWGWAALAAPTLAMCCCAPGLRRRLPTTAVVYAAVGCVALGLAWEEMWGFPITVRASRGFLMWPKTGTLLLGLLLAWHGGRMMRLEAHARRTAASGRCAACGYDLTGLQRTPGAPVCPECGDGAPQRP